MSPANLDDRSHRIHGARMIELARQTHLFILGGNDFSFMMSAGARAKQLRGKE